MLFVCSCVCLSVAFKFLKRVTDCYKPVLKLWWPWWAPRQFKFHFQKHNDKQSGVQANFWGVSHTACSPHCVSHTACRPHCVSHTACSPYCVSHTACRPHCVSHTACRPHCVSYWIVDRRKNVLSIFIYIMWKSKMLICMFWHKDFHPEVFGTYITSNNIQSNTTISRYVMY